MTTYKFKRNHETILATGQSEAQVRKRLDLCFHPEAHSFFHVNSSHAIQHYLDFIGTSIVHRTKFFMSLDRVSRTNKPLNIWLL